MILKGTSLEGFTDSKIQEIEDWINNTPMKVLGYLTPNEKMANILINKEQLTSGALQERM